MAICIICHEEHVLKTIEHIVPRALGNIHYILRKGLICRSCNNRFAQYEHAVLNSEEWWVRRKKLGLIGKRNLAPLRAARDHELRRFILKMFYEGLYHSRKEVFQSTNLENIRLELALGQDSKAVIIRNKSILKGLSVPRWIHAWRLRRNRLKLFYQLTERSIFIEFRFVDLGYVLEVEREEGLPRISP